MSTSPTPTPPIPDSADEPPSSLPLPLSASLVLTSLPQDAHTALEKASAEDVDGIPAKVTIRFHPVGSAPALKQRIFKISSTSRFETVVAFLSKKLAAAAAAAGPGGERGEKNNNGGGGAVFCYVNSVFAPGLDEGVGGLWRCFRTDEQLIVAYSVTPAFG
ncbi:hypothetical protein ACLMJK_007826 [Lecanora helva]